VNVVEGSRHIEMLSTSPTNTDGAGLQLQEANNIDN